jgi:exopolysaccharide biosynthesis protein
MHNRMARRANSFKLLRVVLFLAVALTARHAVGDEPSLSWHALGADIEQADARLNPDSVFSSSIVMVRSSLSRFRLQVIRASDFDWKRATVRAMCRAAGASVCINSNFFDEQGKALGLVMSRGIIHQKLHRGGGTLTGVFFVKAKSLGIAHRDHFSYDGVIEATQSGPRLISQSAIVPGLKESSFRTNLSGICLDKHGRVVLYRVTSGVFGSSLPLLQRLLLSPSVECVEALNFDGGGSSQFYIAAGIPGHSGATREEDFRGTDEVPVALGLVPINPGS